MDAIRERRSAAGVPLREEEQEEKPVCRSSSSEASGREAGVEEEILIEEMSIDGMCGVY